MTTTIDTTEQALLRAILDTPADDAPRLIYADWLEENGQPERAEFIRVQCELARIPAEDLAETNFWEGQLSDGPARYFPIAKLLRKSRKKGIFVKVSRGLHVGNERPLIECIFHRGFSSEIRCTLGEWLQHGPRIVAEHPVEWVRLTDFRPWRLTRDGFGIIWDRECPSVRRSTEAQKHDEDGDVPHEIYQLLRRGRLDHDGSEYRSYQEDTDLFADLSQACLAWAKKTPENEQQTSQK